MDAQAALRSLESTSKELQDAMAAVNHARRVLLFNSSTLNTAECRSVDSRMVSCR